MALKITKSIGTNYGITNEAYVRISTYNIQKNGNVMFSLELFNSKPIEISDSLATPMHSYQIASNVEIGTNLTLQLTKKETKTRTVKRQVAKDVQVTETITEPSIVDGGEPIATTKTRTETRQVMEDVDETYEIDVPDLSILSTTPIFEFAYGKLKEKLQKLFGKANVIDC